MTSLDLTYNKLSKLGRRISRPSSCPTSTRLDVPVQLVRQVPVVAAQLRGPDGLRHPRPARRPRNRCLRECPRTLPAHRPARILHRFERPAQGTISRLIYHLDIGDNPNITFDASAICYHWQQGAYNLIYDKTQNILNCDKCSNNH